MAVRALSQHCHPLRRPRPARLGRPGRQSRGLTARAEGQELERTAAPSSRPGRLDAYLNFPVCCGVEHSIVRPNRPVNFWCLTVMAATHCIEHWHMRQVLAIIVFMYYATLVSPMCTSLPASCLKLRGGGWFGGDNQKNVATDPAVDPKSIQEKSIDGQHQPQVPQQSLMGHAVEYALAGGLDGIRSGVSQGIGEQKNLSADPSIQYLTV
jgi:hypothetical protein